MSCCLDDCLRKEDERDDLETLLSLLRSRRNGNLRNILNRLAGLRVEKETILALQSGRAWSIPQSNFSARVLVHSVGLFIRATIQFSNGNHVVNMPLHRVQTGFSWTLTHRGRQIKFTIRGSFINSNEQNMVCSSGSETDDTSSDDVTSLNDPRVWILLGVVQQSDRRTNRSSRDCSSQCCNSGLLGFL